jgi:Domain of unknown function (DUF4160)
VSPTVLRSGPYRFFFFSSDHDEPPHVHVTRERKVAKLWLAGGVAYNRGFTAKELATVSGVAAKHRDELMRAWDEFFESDH